MLSLKPFIRKAGFDPGKIENQFEEDPLQNPLWPNRDLTTTKGDLTMIMTAISAEKTGWCPLSRFHIFRAVGRLRDEGMSQKFDDF